MYYLNQYIITYLATVGGIDASQTTGIKLQSVAGVTTNRPGILVLDYTDPLDESKCEWVSYTSIDGSQELVGAVRGVEKGSAKTHAQNTAIGFPVSKSHINQISDVFHAAATNSLAENILLAGQATPPTTPDSGFIKFYFDSSGNIHKLDSAGVDAQLEFRSDAWIDVADAATMTFDLSVANKKLKYHAGPLAGNRTFALSNITAGQIFMIRIQQDGTGSRTVTWPTVAVAAITMTIAAPGVVTLGKDIKTGTPIKFSTTGALPTGVTAGTTYYWIRVNSTTGNLATTKANALAGTQITTSGSQSGVHAAAIGILWTGGSAPTLTTSKHAWDDIGFIIDTTEQITGTVIGQDM